MTKTEVRKMITKCADEAKHNYRQGNIKEGKKWEKQLKFFKELEKGYE